MIIAFIYINFERTSKSAKKCQKELGTFVSSKKCQEVSKNAKFAFFGTKNARLATMTSLGPGAGLARPAARPGLSFQPVNKKNHEKYKVKNVSKKKKIMIYLLLYETISQGDDTLTYNLYYLLRMLLINPHC